MNIIVSFSGRKNGNCDTIAKYISAKDDLILFMREISVQPCAGCDYECMSGQCKYRDDGIYSFFEKISLADKVFFIVPMYCGNPSALYFIMSERCQDYFMQNESQYDKLVDKLYIIGIYGNAEDYPDFLKLFARQYSFDDVEEHILGLERHKYNHKMTDFLLNEDDVKIKLDKFIKKCKSELLFYDAYEEFYAMAGKSNAFRAFCIDAFGQDFSQDGFSDIHQIDLILQYVPTQDEVHVLDIGCGNGKMLGYLQKKTGAYIHGFDYSKQAIKTAQELFPINAEFKEGIIGEIDYPEEKFDAIISMDTMYFAKDMAAFVAQIKKWLKADGVFFVGYQEGDVMPKTRNSQTTVLSDALDKNGMIYEVTDITKQTYDMLQLKRKSALAHQAEFEAEGHRNWFDMLMLQTECILEPFEQFKEKMARYIYVIRK